MNFFESRWRSWCNEVLNEVRFQNEEMSDFKNGKKEEEKKARSDTTKRKNPWNSSPTPFIPCRRPLHHHRWHCCHFVITSIFDLI